MRLIDADALKQIIGSYNPIKHTYEYGSVITVADIDNAPTIEAEPVKQGKWIADNDPNADPFFRKGWKCSVCGSRTSYGTPPYCMRCGAKMENEE